MSRVPEKVVEVELPRMNLQMVQEWSTPAHKKMTKITDEADERMLGTVTTWVRSDTMFWASVIYLYIFDILVSFFKKKYIQ